MPITELLVTGYDGDKAVFAVTLAPDEANVVLTNRNGDDETVVESAWQQTTDAFTEVQTLLEQAIGVPPLPRGVSGREVRLSSLLF